MSRPLRMIYTRMYMKLSGFLILLAALAVTSTHRTLHAEEIDEKNYELQQGSSEFEAESNEVQSKMSQGAQRGIASESPQEKAQVLEFDKVNEKEARQSKKELFYKCVKGRELRWMRLYYMKNRKCKTVYSKEGSAKEMSTAYSYDSCEAVVSNIRKNLETAGYNCEEKILLGSLELK